VSAQGACCALSEKFISSLDEEEDMFNSKWMLGTALLGVLSILIGNNAVSAKSNRAGEPPAIPDTPAGKVFATWLKNFNSGDTKAMLAFHTQRLSPEEAAQVVRQEASGSHDSGGLELKKIEKSEATELIALVQAKLTERWLQVNVQVAPEPPHRLTGLNVRPGRNPSATKVKMSEAEIVRALDAYVEKLAKGDVFSGTVLVAKDDKILFKKAYGLASKAYNVRNQVDTKFNLGSMNKMFTAVTIAQLAQQGKLSFTDTVGKFLPDYPNKDVAQKVTIHQLLTHTSGLKDYFNEKFMETSRDKFREVNDYLPLFQKEPLNFEPGSKWDYSNAGFMLLGAIIEKVTGQNYFEYVREHLYKPAGMTNTDAYELDRDTPNLATGYTRETSDDVKVRKNNIFLHVLKGGPAGGGYSTVEDLHRFALALKQNKLLSAETTEKVIGGKVEMTFAGGSKYAYGFMDKTVNGQRIVGHGGGFPGLNSDLNIYLDSGYIVAVMSNYDPPTAQRVSDKFQEWLLSL
jgi:CubicO group peptidase (beta-lactamase class C family)